MKQNLQKDRTKKEVFETGKHFLYFYVYVGMYVCIQRKFVNCDLICSLSPIRACGLVRLSSSTSFKIEHSK